MNEKQVQMREKLFESTIENLKVVVDKNEKHEMTVKIYFYDLEAKRA